LNGDVPLCGNNKYVEEDLRYLECDEKENEMTEDGGQEKGLRDRVDSLRPSCVELQCLHLSNGMVVFVIDLNLFLT